MSIPVLKVVNRTEIGKSAVAQLRRTGMIPATCYGKGLESLTLSVSLAELTTVLRGPKGLNALIRLDGTKDERTVFVQEMQRDPLVRNILHVDFIHVDASKPIQRHVKIEMVGKPEGVKLGGILQMARREVLIEARPDQIPDKISIDVAAMLIGDSVHVTELVLPEGVKAVYDRNFTICAVVAPVEEKAAETEGEAEGEAGAEGEAKADGEKTAGEKKD